MSLADKSFFAIGIWEHISPVQLTLEARADVYPWALTDSLFGADSRLTFQWRRNMTSDRFTQLTAGHDPLSVYAQRS